MKLKEFNAENTVSTRGGGSTTPSININLKAGLICINKHACELMDLKDNDLVVIHQDEDEKSNWYLEKVKTKGFKIRQNLKASAGLLFNNTAMAKAIAGSVDFKGNSGKVLVAGKPTILDKRKLWGLILSGFTN